MIWQQQKKELLQILIYKSKKEYISQENISYSNSSSEKNNKIKANRITKNLYKENNINIKGINFIKDKNRIKNIYIVQNEKTDINICLTIKNLRISDGIKPIKN